MAIILDNLICTVAIFLLTFAWVYYVLRNAQLAFALASIVALCGSYVIWQGLKKYFSVQNKRKADKQQRTDLMTYLRFNTDNIKLFTQMANYYDFDVKDTFSDGFVASKDDQITYFAISFANDCIKGDASVPFVISAKRNKANKMYLLCNKADGNALSLANSQLPTQVIDTNNLYNLLEQSNLLPPLPKQSKQKFSVLGSYALCKARAKSYFGCGIFLLLTSFFGYAKIYNIVWASILCVIGVYCIFNKKYNVLPTCITLK